MAESKRYFLITVDEITPKNRIIELVEVLNDGDFRCKMLCSLKEDGEILKKGHELDFVDNEIKEITGIYNKICRLVDKINDIKLLSIKDKFLNGRFPNKREFYHMNKIYKEIK